MVGERAGIVARLLARVGQHVEHRVVAVALVVATPTTKVWMPALAALVTAVTAGSGRPSVSLVVPAQDGSPSVASRMYFGLVSGSFCQVRRPPR